MAIELMAVTFRALLILHYRFTSRVFRWKLLSSAQINATRLRTYGIRRGASRCRWSTLSGVHVDTLPIKSIHG
jgi:hypothetical protein